MNRSTQQLRQDALRIWRAGVAAVDSERLVREALRVEGSWLRLVTPAGEERSLDLTAIRRIAVVGAGKAGAGMAAGVEHVLGPKWLKEKQVVGWINVPADCLRPLSRIHLHPTRPAGRNEPTAEGVQGAEAILRLARSLGPDDLCLCLISGGASALLPAPAEGIMLADKLAVTRHLSAAGANIQELNTVRKQLSRIKGGGLLRACRAGQLVTLVISDVIGDPLDTIGSGPTIDDPSTPAEALAVLDRYDPRRTLPTEVFAYLEDKGHKPPNRSHAEVQNLVIGNNARAVDAAGVEAEKIGYSHAMHTVRELENDANEAGRQLAQIARSMRDSGGPDCLISGGEPVVTLIDEQNRGLGGRNQQLVLAAAVALAEDGAQGIALLSGGTDGEDGPTDAAWAFLDADVLAAARRAALDARVYLLRNDAYHFFERVGALIKTGPTHTNVCDLRVVVCDRPAQPS